MQANLLRGKMAEAGYTQAELAAAMIKSKNTISDKLAGKKQFTCQEAETICRLLSITDPAEMAKIFLLSPSQK